MLLQQNSFLGGNTKELVLTYFIFWDFKKMEFANWLWPTALWRGIVRSSNVLGQELSANSIWDLMDFFVKCWPYMNCYCFLNFESSSLCLDTDMANLRRLFETCLFPNDSDTPCYVLSPFPLSQSVSLTFLNYTFGTERKVDINTSTFENCI